MMKYDRYMIELEARPPPTWDFLRATQQQTSNIHTSSRSSFAPPTYLTTLNTASILNKANATKQTTYPSPQSSTKRMQQTSQHATQRSKQKLINKFISRSKQDRNPNTSALISGGGRSQLKGKTFIYLIIK